MPQFRVQRSNTHFFFFKISATFFLTQSVKDTRNKNKNKNAINRTHDANKKTNNRTRIKHEPGQILPQIQS